jgi:hypothetical protein
MVGDDFRQLCLDVFGLCWLTTQAAERFDGFVNLATLHKVSRRIWESCDATAQNQCPKELDCNGNAVGAAVVEILCPIVHTRCQHEADCDTELITRHKSTAHLLWSDLGHVQDNNGGFEADAETSDKTTCGKNADTRGGSLNDDTDDEDYAACNNGELSSNEVGDVTSDDGSKEGTCLPNQCPASAS